MVLAKMVVTKHLKEECMYHKQFISCFENDPDYHQLTTNRLNRILHQTGELSSKYLLWRTNEKYDRMNTPKYKTILADYVDQNKPDIKNKLNLVTKILDYIMLY